MNDIAPKTATELAKEVILRLQEYKASIPESPHRTMRQRIIEETINLMIELCEQIEQLEA